MLQINGDWEIFDNRETITITNKNSSPVTVQNVIRRSATLDIIDAAGKSAYSTSIAFIIWKENVPSGFVPKLHALVVDYLGKRYHIDMVNDGTLRSRWYIQCTSETNQGIN